jgi:hypothetical protein
VHTQPRTMADSGTRGPTYHTPERGEITGGENSPTVRSSTRPRLPAYSLPSRELNGARGAAKGAREAGCRHAWRSDGAGGRWWGVPGHGMTNGGAREQPRCSAVLVCVKRAREVEWRGGVHGAELSGELEHAPVSDSRLREPYHGLLRRAQGARGGGGALGEM